MNISQQILDDFRQGNIESFYMELYPSLLRYAERVLGVDDAFEAEDCLQEAIYKVYSSRRSFRDPMHMRTFMFTCIHNEIVSLFRKRDTRNRYVGRQTEEVEDCLFDNLVLQETLDRLYSAIDRLPPQLREVFEMSFEQGLENVEIARRLQVSAETVKKRKARLIGLLRRQLSDDLALALLLFVLSD